MTVSCGWTSTQCAEWNFLPPNNNVGGVLDIQARGALHLCPLGQNDNGALSAMDLPWRVSEGNV